MQRQLRSRGAHADLVANPEGEGVAELGRVRAMVSLVADSRVTCTNVVVRLDARKGLLVMRCSHDIEPIADHALTNARHAPDRRRMEVGLRLIDKRCDIEDPAGRLLLSLGSRS